MQLVKSKRNAIIASAQTVGPSDQAAIQRIHAARRHWQLQAIDLYYKLAELHYPANYMGSMLSRFRYPAGCLPADQLGADPVVLDRADMTDLDRAAEEAMFAFEGPAGGVAEMARTYAMNMAMTGDGWIVGEDHGGQPTTWEFLSVRELVATDQGTWLRNSVGAVTSQGFDATYKPSFTARVWRPDPFSSQVADAATSALISDCQQLLMLNESVTSRLLTRLGQAGVLFLDSSLQVPGAVQAPNGDGGPVQDPFYTKFLDTIEKAITQREKASGSIPIIVRGQGKPTDLISFITMDRSIDRVEMELRAELRSNIAKGQDLPPETQTGMGDTTHFQAWSIGDETYQSHGLPEAKRFADAVTREYLWRYLRDWAKGVNRSAEFPEHEIRRRVVVADGSSVVTRPNRAEDVRQLHAFVAVSDRYARESVDVGDDAKPTEEEYVQQLGVQINNPYLATYGMDIHDKIDWSMVAATPAGEGAPGEGGTPPSKRPADSSDPTGAPGIKDGKKNAADLFAAAASGHVAAAMKTVGAKVRARCEPHQEVFAAVKSAPNEKVLARLEAEHLDVIELAERDIAEFYVDALRPMGTVLTEASDELPSAEFTHELALLLASRPTKPVSLAELRHIALRVLSGTDT